MYHRSLYFYAVVYHWALFSLVQVEKGELSQDEVSLQSVTRIILVLTLLYFRWCIMQGHFGYQKVCLTHFMISILDKENNIFTTQERGRQYKLLHMSAEQS